MSASSFLRKVFRFLPDLNAAIMTFIPGKVL